jgi:Rhodopirellula transposase DDE domain
MSKLPERGSEAAVRVAEAMVATRWRLFGPECDERRRRLWAAAEAHAHGPGGVAVVARATGISQDTIRRGLVELTSGERLQPERVRRPGGGRKPVIEADPTVVEDLERLVQPVTRGELESPLRWTLKSGAKLAHALRGKGHDIVDRTALRLLNALGYSLQANRGTREAASDPDRDAQFEHINETAKAALQARQPVISIDARKKQVVHRQIPAGRPFADATGPIEAAMHDFSDAEIPRPVPADLSDITDGRRFVSVGISADTAELSVSSVRAWWEHLGRKRFPGATKLTITADCGGPHTRVGLWKGELQHLADDTGLEIQVCHVPAGTFKWNNVEHRLYSFLSPDWPGRPLDSYQVIVDLIGSATANSGDRKLYARLEDTHARTRVNVSEEPLAAVNISEHEFHPEWNYTITPSAVIESWCWNRQ